MKIDKRYKTTSIGIYNRNVFECPECGTCILNDYYKHICGIAEVPIGTVSINMISLLLSTIWYCQSLDLPNILRLTCYGISIRK